MYLLVIFLPLLNSLLVLCLGHKLYTKHIFKLVVANMLLTLFISYFICYEVVFCKSPCYVVLTDWIFCTTLHVSWGFLFDTLTALMLIVVNSISTCVHIYSIEYMSEDPFIKRFLSYLSLFTFFMLMLITADNFLQMFLGWEGVGLCSYLLINFWFQRIQANKAAIKAMVVNRVGDFGLALGIFTFFYIFKTLNYNTIFNLVPLVTEKTLVFFDFQINALSLACFFIFIGCVGKSAQIGLHTWLPDAMEGPTPVSALIHAATMVTAGIFLTARCSPIFQYVPSVSFIITILGAFTAFLAGTTGLAQNDLKRVIAYSTCSQLGYMFFVAGVSSYHVSFFHLANHAFFKALLFLGAGSVIHSLADEQDMRKMGGLSDTLVYTCVCMVIGSAALGGFPFSTGFYSKDVILELTGVFFSLESTFANWLGDISVATTVFYSTRSLVYTFVGKPLTLKKNFAIYHESDGNMAISLFLLSVGGLIIGYISKDLVIGLGINLWQESICIKTSEWTFFEAEYLDTWIKDIPLVFGFIGGLGAAYFYSENKLTALWFNWKISFAGRKLYTFLNRKWFFDKVYNEFISQRVLNIAYNDTYQNIDRGLLEAWGPNGLSRQFYSLTNEINKVTLAFLYHYVVILLISISLVLLIFIYWSSIILIMDPRMILFVLVSILISTKILKK